MDKLKIKLDAKNFIVLTALIVGAGLLVGNILFAIANTMSNELEKIQFACNAQALFGDGSQQCFWGMQFLSLNHIVFAFGWMAIGFGILFGAFFLVYAFAFYNEMRVLDKAILLNPSDSSLYAKRGKAWRQRGEPHKALADYEKAIELDPNSIAARMFRAALYIRKQDWDFALTDLNIILKHDPHNASAYNSRGLVHEKKQENQKALSDYEKATSLNPTSRIYKNNLTKLKAKIDIDKGKSS